MTYTIDNSSCVSDAALRIIDRARQQRPGMTRDALGVPATLRPESGSSLPAILRRIAALEDILSVVITAEADPDDEGTGDAMQGGLANAEVRNNTVVSTDTDEGETLRSMNAANAAKYRANEPVTAGSQSAPAPGFGRETEGKVYMPSGAGTIIGRESRTAPTLNRGTVFGSDRVSLALGDHFRNLSVRTNEVIGQINARNAKFFERKS